jgi:hypothetical protein
MSLQPWKMFTDTAEHYKVFQAVRGLSTGVYSNDEFKSKLKNIDLSDLENYREHIKVLIKNALKEDEPVAEAAIEEVAKEIAAEDAPVIKAPATRKRSCKVNNEVAETE